MTVRRIWFTISIIALLGVGSCEKGSTPSANFDRRPMLENWANNIIVPAFDSLRQRSLKLQVATGAFVNSPDVTTLDEVRATWLSTYLAYQHCAFFNFGPADDLLLNNSINTFPTSKTKVDNNISSGSYNLASVSNNDAKGLSALDYLLHGLSTDETELLNYYITDANAANRKQYLQDVVDDIAARSVNAYNKWSAAGDNYIATFVARTGNDVGSSTGMLINAMIQYLETGLRDAKIAIPLGVRSLNVPIPNNCEALHAEKSIVLAIESATALQNIYLGKKLSDGIGLDDNLSAINARYNGGSLNDAIKAQLTLALTKVSSIPEPYSETVMNNQTPPTQAYQELQKLTLLLKTDMTSALGILITYQDNDGD